MKKYNTLVYIGRFQPFHKAHLETIKIASTLCNKLIIIVGSDNSPRTLKNPFTSSERINMIKGTIEEYNDTAQLDDLINIDIIYKTVEDSVYDDDLWCNRIKTVVNDFNNVGIIGHVKDDSSFYLKEFPEWEHVNIERILDIDATDIREEFYQEHPHHIEMDALWYINRIGEYSYNFLKDFIKTEDFKKLSQEYQSLKEYKKQFENLPYPPVFVTVDALVTFKNKILLIRRKDSGLLALPGGFLDAKTDKSLKDAMFRELSEETSIDTSKCLVESFEVFDALERDNRGRIITHVFKIMLYSETLPSIKGSDDAIEALWMNIKDLNCKDFYGDHYDIILKMLDNDKNDWYTTFNG